MKWTFLGGASEVGASCTLVEIADHRLLIDGGIRPAARAGQPRLPDLAPLEQSPPEAILLTHAHIDHTGGLPLIASLYPRIPIYATESTRVLTEILLRDSVRLMEQEALRPDGEIPLYSAEQVDGFLTRITPVSMSQALVPLPDAPDLTVRFLPAGHILGAAMLLFETVEGRVLHTGDISVTDQRTIKGLDVLALPQADLMICEGTYGNRAHTSRREEERRLAETVQTVLARGGRIVLPAFAVGRAQEVVLILKAYRASGQISPVPVYLDGMVRTVCTAYQLQAHDLHPSLQRQLTNSRRPLFADPDLHIYAVRSQDREALVARATPMIVIASSGMLTGGTSPLYAAETARREQDCLVFSGYQDEESPGAALLRARRGDRLQLGEQHVTLACQVERYNLSGHADAEQIVHVVSRVNPTRLVLVHGVPEALEALAKRFPKIPVDIPAAGSTIELSFRGGSARHVSTDEGVAPRSLMASAPGAQMDSVQPRPTPTIEQIWQVARQQGPVRPWTAVELGQHYYGAAYRPAQRSEVEQVLREASPYFKIGRVGAQPTYLPRATDEVEYLRPIAELTAGEIVLVQGQPGQGAPQIACVLSAPQEGTVSLVADQWKGGSRPMKVIQLLPGMRRADLALLSAEEARAALRDWRTRIEEEWVDLLAWWKHREGKAFTYDALCATCRTEDEKLAWGLELLAHGVALFRREGLTWMPIDAQRVYTNEGHAHHLRLLEAGAGTGVAVNERRGTLTGRSSWRLFEVRWAEGEESGELVSVRTRNIAVVDDGFPFGPLPGERV
ncbi:MAG: MBL fold metallo-hydrolase [Ktedonobacteraceae bacterium]